MKEATETLETKSEAVTKLEQQVAELQTSLESAEGNAAANKSASSELEDSKKASEEAQKASETELAELKASLDQLRAQHEEDAASLKAVEDEVRVVCSLPFSPYRVTHSCLLFM